MLKKEAKTDQTDSLRSRAEKRILKPQDNIRDLTATGIKKLVHELQVHQIELEMQNDALQKSQIETADERRKYTDLFDFAPIGYFTLDGTGNIIEANVTGASLLNWEKRALAEQPFYRFIDPECFSTFQSHLHKCRELRTKQLSTIRLAKRNGNPCDLLMETIAVFNDKGKFDHYRSSVTDVSELMRIQVALREQTAQLQAANKEMESFNYSVSHDLRSPLRAIDGYARMILRQEGNKFDEETTRKFNMIRANIQQMGLLIDGMLNLSRLGRQDLSTVKLDLARLANDVWNEMQALNPERVIKFTLSDMPQAFGDRMLIKQVFVNLLGNAIKFTKHCAAAEVEAGGCVKDKELVYYVRDNGAGFDMAYYNKLFGMFQRLHSADDFEGTGIGLAIVQRIIHKHGGRVWAEGEINKGATFYFTLPAN